MLAAAVPAVAKTHPTHPSHPAHPSHPYSIKSHKCAVRKVAFVESGTLVSWSATAGTDGTYSGDIVVTIKHANHHAKSTSGTQTITLSSAKVRLGHGVTAPAAGDRVKLIGKITTVSKKCTDTSGAGTVTIRRVIVSAAKSSK
jgi:hypothetical protein